jgi:hypothetical protein
LLDSSGLGVRGISLFRPTLDDVFLKKTGRSLREADQPSVRDERSRETASGEGRGK